jgi:uncharacterized membrane protein YdjX (TVP38/TMEM64 family)
MTRLTAILPRLLTILVILGGLVLAWHYRGLAQPQIIRNMLTGQAYAPLIFIGIHVVASLFFVPRTVLAVAAGLIWGLWWGTLWTLLGGIAGALLCFLVARYLNAGFFRPENMPKFGQLLQRMERGGWRSVAILRLVPIMPHSPVNYAFGLTEVSLASYLFGTAIGIVPMTIFYADIGAAGGQALTGSGGWVLPTLIGLGALGLSFLLPKLGFMRGRDA